MVGYMEGENVDTILYIDDERTNLILFESVFSEFYNVITTSSTQKAREYLNNEEIKVVLCDLRMPEENGLEFIKSVSPVFPDVFYLILSAHFDIETVLKAVNYDSIYRYLLKPWNENEILQSINSAIETYNLRLENRKLIAQLHEKNRRLKLAMNQIRDREQQFFNIFHHNIDGIVIFRQNGEIVLSNPAFNKYIKQLDREIVNIQDLLSGHHLQLFKSRLEIVDETPLNSAEYELIMPNNEMRYIEGNIATINYKQEKVIMAMLRDITERKLMEKKIIDEVIQAEERERYRLASDLHDGLGPVLSTLKMYIERLSDKSFAGNKDQILQLSTQSIHEAISQLRTISHNISPHILEKFGLIPAIQSQIDLIKQSSKIEFKIHSDIKERLPANIEMTLFRVIKECMNNTIKHSEASNVFIDILKNHNTLKINFTDNGKGFDTSEIAQNSKGMGMYNIKNRISSIMGEIDIISQKNKGTSIRILVHL